MVLVAGLARKIMVLLIGLEGKIMVLLIGLAGKIMGGLPGKNYIIGKAGRENNSITDMGGREKYK